MGNALFIIVNHYSFLLAKGVLATITLWFLCSLLSCIIGFVTGIIRSDHCRIAVFSSLCDGSMFIFRAVPLYVQLLFAYFVIPEIIGINISAAITGCITLGLCSGAYTSEIIRGGINALSRGQWDASFVLGYTRVQQLYYIVIPQVMRATTPMLLNECNAVLKSTAILATIGTVELTKIGMNIAIRSLDPLPIYTIIAIIYMLLTMGFTWVSRMIEKRLYL